MQKNAPPTFLLCIPTFNEAPIIARTVQEVVEALNRIQDISWRLVIADNGSSDGTADIVEALGVPNVSVERINERGKGRAVRTIASMADADIFGFIDADLSAHPKHIDEFISMIRSGQANIVIGSRLLDISRSRREAFRSLSSKFFNFTRRNVLPFPVVDSQCGLKLMDANGVAELRACQEDGWFFDMELLARAHSTGLAIKEQAIDWDEHHFPGRASKLRMFSDGIAAFKAIVRIRNRLQKERRIAAPGITAIRTGASNVLKIVPGGFLQKMYSTVLSPRPVRMAVNGLIKLVLPSYVKINGHKLYLHPDDVVVSGALTFGVYEVYPREVFRDLIKPGNTVVDVGANVGVYTLTAHQAGANVIAYEPDSGNRDVLARSLKEGGIDTVRLSPEALGVQAGTASLYLHPHNKGKHSLLDTGEHAQVAIVPVSTLDASLSAFGASKIDVIKIDVEGYEAHVIEGGMATLRRDKPAIFFEFAPVRIQLAGKSPVDMLKTLVGLGYELFMIDERNRALVPVGDPEAFAGRFARKDAIINILAR